MVQPTRRAADYRQALPQTSRHVGKRRIGVREFNGDIGRVGRKISDAYAWSTRVHDARNDVAALRGEGGNGLAHFAVADEENVHFFG